MVRHIALIAFATLLAYMNALHCWTGTSQAKYYQEDCESIPQDKGSTYCGTLVMKVGGVTSKGCGGTFAAQGAKCEKDGTQNVALGSLTCCSGKDYCNGDGAGGEGTPANTTTTTAT
ncbi:hypothetical protein AAVH_43178, partial [Aphelenchoides avenae]